MNRRESLRLLGAAALCGVAAPQAHADGQSFLNTLQASSGAPGAALGLWDGQTRIWAQGQRAANAADPVQPDDLWHIGSNAKSMTALMIARLIETRQLRWSSQIGALLGDHVPQMRESYKRRTIHDLLTHRAGIHPNPDTLRLLRFAVDQRPARVQHLLLAQHMLARSPTSDGPPFGFTYSNAGYIIATAMAEAATGQDWQDLMHREVFTPLKMPSAGFGPPPEGNPQGHDSKTRPQGFGPQADNPLALWPAGAVHLSIADHLTYLRAHLNRHHMLRRATWQKLLAPLDTYACGWGVIEGRVWGHSGSNTMWLSHAVFCPETDRAAIANMNLKGRRETHSQLARLNDWARGRTTL